MKKTLRSFFLIINYKTLIITTLAVISSEICYRVGLIAKFPDMLVGVAIVFPVVFSIGSAYNRRETALQRFSDFKGHAITLYYATRDWIAPEKQNQLAPQIRKMIGEMVTLIREMFTSSHRHEWEDNEKRIYSYFSDLSRMTLQMRELGVQSTEISRINQYISKMIIAFDNLIFCMSHGNISPQA